MKLIFSFTLLLISIISFAEPIEDMPFELSDVRGISHAVGDEFFTTVSSITTSDENLFPGVGQIILHTSSFDKRTNLKGVVIVSPERIRKIHYFSIDRLNLGRVINIIKATKFGITTAVLKLQLDASTGEITPETGGQVIIKIIKNGIFGSYYNFKVRLKRVSSDWLASVRLGQKYNEFKTIYLKAGTVGVKRVDFR